MDQALKTKFQEFPGLSGSHWNHHLLAIIKRQSLMRILHLNEIYRQILDVPGVICEFGVQFGSSLSLITNMRAIYEPYNVSRLVFGFDTFSGIAGSDEVRDLKDLENAHAVPDGYQKYLEELLRIHEELGPLGHLQRTHLYAGDAREQVALWKADWPGMPIALLHLDMDVYAPTRVVIESLLDRLTRGSVIIFDELTAPFFPGESQAVIDTLGLGNLRLRRTQFNPYSAWAIWGQ